MGWFHTCEWVIEKDFKYCKKCQRVVNFPKEEDKYWKKEYEDDRIYIKKNGKRLKCTMEITYFRDEMVYKNIDYTLPEFEEDVLTLLLKILNDKNVYSKVEKIIKRRRKQSKYDSTVTIIGIKSGLYYYLEHLIEYKGLYRAFEIIKNCENYK